MTFNLDLDALVNSAWGGYERMMQWRWSAMMDAGVRRPSRTSTASLTSTGSSHAR